jgi:hypothetical protein
MSASAKLCAVLGLIVVLWWHRSGAPAQPGPSPSPSPVWGCPVAVAGVVPLGGAAGASSTYAIGVQAFSRQAADVSGTLALFTENRRYDVAFENAVAAGYDWESLAEIVPVVVKFTEPVHIDAAYVAALAGPNAGPCEPGGVWIGSASHVVAPSKDPLSFASAILRAAGRAKLVEAPASTPWTPGCDRPMLPPALKTAAVPSTPEIAKELAHTGTVVVEVVIGADGGVAASWTFSSPYAELTTASLDAAKRSTFTPALFACHPVAGAYMFVVQFSASPAAP